MFRKTGILGILIGCLLIFEFSLAGAQEGKVIKDIRVEGNVSVSKEVILSKMYSRKGEIYSKQSVSKDVKRLFATGFFEDVQIVPLETGTEVILVVKVKERMPVNKILIEGNRHIPKKKIKEKISLKESEFLDSRKMTESLRAIEKLYREKGFLNVEVDHKLIAREDGSVDVIFEIKEGHRERVVKVVVEGNKSVKTGKILKILKTKKASLWNLGVLSEEKIEEDKQRIRDFYVNKGFLDAQVDCIVEDGRKKGTKIVKFVISEGKQYRLDSISLHGVTIFQKDDLMKLITLRVGDIFVPQKVEDSANAIRDKYFEEGYIFTRVIPMPSVDSKAGKVALVFEVEEGKIAYVRQILIEGNVKTKDKVIRRELRVYPGEKFNGNALKRSMQRLMNLGYFDEVSYDVKDTDDPNEKDLVIRVKERQTGEFSFGAGYSTVDKFVGFIRVSQNNFDITNWPYFTGAGQKLSISYEKGSDKEDYGLSFTEPWIFDKPISAGFDIYRSTHDRETDVGYGYDEERKGVNLRLGRELGEYVRIDGNFRIEKVDIGDVSDNATLDLKREEGSNNLRMLGIDLKLDLRDNVFSPKNGFYLGISPDIAGGIFGGDRDFYRLVVDARLYKTLFGPDDVLSLRLRTGVEDNYDNSNWVPIYERFFAGGAYTIRGYRERKVGPIDSFTGDPIGGEAMLVGNIEYTVPLFDYVKIATFFDFGNVWSDMNDFLSGDIYTSVGVGVRVKTPIGPMKLDYGYPLKKEPGTDKKKGRFHFSISRGF